MRVVNDSSSGRTRKGALSHGATSIPLALVQSQNDVGDSRLSFTIRTYSHWGRPPVSFSFRRLQCPKLAPLPHGCYPSTSKRLLHSTDVSHGDLMVFESHNLYCYILPLASAPQRHRSFPLPITRSVLHHGEHRPQPDVVRHPEDTLLGRPHRRRPGHFN
jgi:hypothetical protein